MARCAVAIAVFAAGCEKAVFTCMTDDNCVVGSMTGTCEPDHLCSFPDSTCLVGRKYADHSGDVSGECVPVNFMFVTSQVIDPSTLGPDPFGIADKQCNDDAEQAGLPGQYIAWISTTATNAIDRLQAHNSRGWIRPDNLPFVDTTTDLVQGHMMYPPRIDETGHDILDDPMPNPFVATGTLTNGTLGGNANDWMSATPYRAGRVSVGRNGWTDNSGRMGPAHLYCFGVDHQIPPPIPNEDGRVAFVSASTFGATGGVSAADAVCAMDASNAGLPGKYRALIATSTVAAADPSRFPPSSLRFVRSDRLPLELAAGDLLQGKLAAPIAFGPRGGFVNNTVLRTWTGAQKPPSPSGAGENCSNWSGSGPAAIAGIENESGPGFFHLANNDLACGATTVHLFCLQYMP